MAIVLIGMIFGSICTAGALLIGTPSLVECLMLYAFSGNLGALAQCVLIYRGMMQAKPA